MAETVGLVGTGAMGQALLERLRLAGRQVRAFDVSEQCLTAAHAGGAEIADSPAAAAESAAFVHVFVRTDAEALDCTLGSSGVLAGAAAGALVFLHSTILPMTTQRVAAAALSRQVRVMDACVTAIPPRVRSGEATFLVGGSDELVNEARAYLLLLGAQVLHFGPLGSGNVAKIVHNLAATAERLVLHDALRISEAGGVDAGHLLDMLRSVHHGGVLPEWEKSFTVEDGHATTRIPPNLFDKDVPLAAYLARSYGLDLPVTRELANEALAIVASSAAPTT